MFNISEAPEMHVPRFSSKTKAAFVCLALAKIWLTRALHLTVIADSDEKTFLLQAQGLLAGHWLGDYTVVTLVKMPFYAVFLAISNLAGVPALMAQQVLYVVACAVFIMAICPALTSWRSYQFLLLFALLVFNPMTYLGGERLARNYFYASLGVLLIGTALGLLVRIDWGQKSVLKWPIFFSMALSAQWLTREESYWILPFLLLYTLILGWLMWRSSQAGWHVKVIALALPYCVVILSILTVDMLNQSKYGVFVANEQQSRAFEDVMGALYCVNSAAPRPRYVVVPQETRERIYAVSPSFAELRSSFEGDLGSQWAALSCQHYDACGNNDVVWGWFIWELRQAAMVAGHQGNAVDAARFYEQVAVEINDASAIGKLSCQRKRATSMPPLKVDELFRLPSGLRSSLKFLSTFRGFSLQDTPSDGTAAQLAEYRDLSLESVIPKPSGLSVSGWALSGSTPAELAVRDGSGQRVESTTQRVSRPDVAAYVKKIGFDAPVDIDSGFNTTTPCTAGCFLYVRGGTNPDKWIKAIPLDGSVRSFQSTAPAGRMQAHDKDPNLPALLEGRVRLRLSRGRCVCCSSSHDRFSKACDLERHRSVLPNGDADYVHIGGPPVCRTVAAMLAIPDHARFDHHAFASFAFAAESNCCLSSHRRSCDARYLSTPGLCPVSVPFVTHVRGTVGVGSSSFVSGG